MDAPILDCLIVGGGPAGLTAATYLARFRRDVLVIDAGASRLKRIPEARNAPGFPDGVAGAELHGLMRRHAAQHGVAVLQGVVESLTATGGGVRAAVRGAVLEARTVLLATGSSQIEPSIPELDRGLEQGLIRYCPICDGYEARGRSIAVLGETASAIEEARFLLTYSDRVTLLWCGEDIPPREDLDGAGARNVSLAPARALRFAIEEDAVTVGLADGGTLSFDVLYPALGCRPQSNLLAGLGARLSHQGGVLTDRHQRTEIPRIYAAGDVLEGLDQIASACGQAAVAAVAIHNDLRAGVPADAWPLRETIQQMA